MQVEWDCPQIIKSRLGELPLNHTDPDTLLRYQVLPEGFQVVPSIRVTQDSLSQMDGAQLHPRFKTGVVVTMTVRCQKMMSATGYSGGENTMACGEDLVDMYDRLALWLNTMRDLSNSDLQRYIWTPTGKAARMLTDVEVLAWPAPSFGGEEGPSPEFTFSLESQFPYGVNETETDTTVTHGSTVNFANVGSADVWPVIQVYGTSSALPVTAFTITNVTTGLEVVYDSGRTAAEAIPAHSYAEIDFERGSIFLNGNSTDLIPGIDPTATDFFTLVADPTVPNQLTITGADMLVKWAPGYS